MTAGFLPLSIQDGQAISPGSIRSSLSVVLPDELHPAGSLGARLCALGQHRAAMASRPKLSALLSAGRGPYKAEELPPEYLDAYGFAVLERTVEVAADPLPAVNYDGVNTEVKGALAGEGGKTLRGLDNLVTLAKGFEEELERLFAVFYFAATMFSFDLELSLADPTANKLSVDEIFKVKKATPAGLTFFIREVATRAGFAKALVLREFLCFEKVLSYNPLRENLDAAGPAGPNHCLLAFSVNGHQYLCDPALACVTGCVKSTFIIPPATAARSYFPVKGCGDLLKFPITFAQFLKQIVFYEDEYGYDCRHESCPFDVPILKKGVKKLYFSCSAAVTSATAKLEQFRNGTWLSQSRNLAGCRFIGPVENGRRRFQLTVVCPAAGQYRCALFLNQSIVACFHPISCWGCEKLLNIPVLDPKYDADVIAPMELRSTAEDGQSVISIRLLKKFARFRLRTALADHETLESVSQWDELGEEAIKSQVVDEEGSETHAELRIAIGFPFAGLQAVVLALAEEGSEEYNDALQLFVNVVQTHGGEVDPPEKLLAPAGEGVE
jgi:hypothetical protein